MDPNGGSGSSHPKNQGLDKFIIDGADGGSPDPAHLLRETYGDNRLVMLPRDPLCFFTYWDATPDRLNALRDQVGDETWQKGQAILRVYDVTGIDGDASRAHRSFDVDIRFDARQWYVQVPEPGRTHVTELGFRFPDGRFLTLLGSNRVTFPRGAVSNETDSRWMIVNVKEWQKMFEAPNHFSHGSAEIAKMMAQRWEFLRSVFSGSSSSLSSGRLVKEEPKR